MEINCPLRAAASPFLAASLAAACAQGQGGKPLTRKEAEAIMMQAGMTRADIRRSVRMAQLPKELHETIWAEVMRRKRLAQNVAINAVWRAFQRLGG